MQIITTDQPGNPLSAHIHLRAMQESDLRAVYKLEKLSQPIPWPAWFFRKQLRTASCWVLEFQGMIIGFGIVAIIKDWAHIMNMCVAPGFRRHGLGRRIMLHLIKVARHHHARYAWLEVRASNAPAIILYRKLGFRKKQIRKRYYSLPVGRENAIVMLLKLQSGW